MKYIGIFLLSVIFALKFTNGAPSTNSCNAVLKPKCDSFRATAFDCLCSNPQSGNPATKCVETPAVLMTSEKACVPNSQNEQACNDFCNSGGNTCTKKSCY